MTRLEGAYGIIEIGQRKEAEGDLRRAHRAYETAIRDFMHLAFVECENVEQVRLWLSAHPLELASNRFVALTQDILSMPTPQWARYFQSGNYLLIAFSHFFTALGQHDRARIVAQAAVEPELFGTIFWGEYAKTLWAMLHEESYLPVLEDLQRVEQYWSNYVFLMQATMRPDGFAVAISEVDRQFTARNSDGKLQEDPYMIDGTGEIPVKFDFRKAGILAAVEDTRKRSSGNQQ